jgi:hypothetical protein
MLAHGGIDALNPKRAKIALLGAAIAVSVLPSLFYGLTGDSDCILAASIKAFGLFQDCLMTGVGSYTPFHTCHVLSPSSSVTIFARSVKPIGRHFFYDARISVLQDNATAGASDELGGSLDHAVALPGLSGDNLAGAGDFEALLHAALCLHLGHFASFRLYLSRGTAAKLQPKKAATPSAFMEKLQSRHGMPLMRRAALWAGE